MRTKKLLSKIFIAIIILISLLIAVYFLSGPNMDSRIWLDNKICSNAPESLGCYACHSKANKAICNTCNENSNRMINTSEFIIEDKYELFALDGNDKPVNNVKDISEIVCTQKVVEIKKPN